MPNQTDEMAQLSFRLAELQLRRIKILAAAQGKSVKEYVLDAVENHAKQANISPETTMQQLVGQAQ